MSAIHFMRSLTGARLVARATTATLAASAAITLSVQGTSATAQESLIASACAIVAVGSPGDLRPPPLSVTLPGVVPNGDAGRADRSVRESCDLALDAAFGAAGRLAVFRDRLALALDTLPPPLLDDFLDHLGRNPDAAAWRPESADLAVLERIAREDPVRFGGFARLRRDWAEGIMTGTVPNAADARAFGLRARACEPTPGSAAREFYAYVPSDQFRSGLTPTGVALAVSAGSGSVVRSRVQSQSEAVLGSASGRSFTAASSGPGAETFDLPDCLDDAARFRTGLPSATLGYTFRWRPRVATEAREVQCASGASMTSALESRRVLRGIALRDGGGISAHPEIGRRGVRARDAGWRVARPGCDAMLAPVPQRQSDGRGWGATARTVQDCELVEPAFPRGTRVADVARLEWESGEADGFDVAWTREDMCHRVEPVTRERSLPCAGGARGSRVEASGGLRAVYSNGSSRTSWGPWFVVSNSCPPDGRTGDAGRRAAPGVWRSGVAGGTQFANAGGGPVGKLVGRPEGWRS